MSKGARNRAIRRQALQIWLADPNREHVTTKTIARRLKNARRH